MVELLAFGGDILTCFLTKNFYDVVYASGAEVLVGGFNLLCSFS
jgi:hypothetical protein